MFSFHRTQHVVAVQTVTKEEFHSSQTGKSEEQFPKKTCWSSVGQLSVVCRPTVDRLLAVCLPTTVGRLSANRFWLKYEAAVDQQSADRQPTVGDVLVICQ